MPNLKLKFLLNAMEVLKLPKEDPTYLQMVLDIASNNEVEAKVNEE